MKPWLLIKTGGTIPEIVPVHGDFENWFETGIACSQMLRVDVHRGQNLPRPSDVSAVVITGSIAMVSHREQWSEATADWLLDALDSRLPVLGVCYGHQLLAQALGGRVGQNPKGREMGTVAVNMKPAIQSDPLFGNYPQSFPAQTSHLETVLELPNQSELLGNSDLDENMIARFSETSWGVQYHPEFSAEVTREYIRLRAPLLLKEGLDPETMKAGVEETPLAASILPAFAQKYISVAAA